MANSSAPKSLVAPAGPVAATQTALGGLGALRADKRAGPSTVSSRPSP